MEVWLSVIIAVLFLVILGLLYKIYLLHKSADEISISFAEKMVTDTNTIIDISSRDSHMSRLAKVINDELRKLIADRRKYQQGDMEIKEAVTNISHDLRTPLTAICGYLELLENEEKSDEAARYIDVISNRTEIMKHLTEELFKYSVVTSTIDDMCYEKVVINNVLEESISSYYTELKKACIVPEISMCETKIVRVLDANALSRIFGNIISNAIKYSDGDLKISLTENGNIVFSNHASSLDKVQVGKLFNRFYTVENAEKSTGLGLSISKLLTEKMNGSISLEYENGIISVYISFS